MTFFAGDFETDNLPSSPQLSAGPQTGFMQNFAAAYNEQAHVRSAFGADEDMANLEQQQLDKVYDLTGERMQPLFPGIYSNTSPNEDRQYAIMHGLNGEQLSADQQKAFDQAQGQMAKLTALAQQHPGLLDYGQMFKQVQTNAKSMVADDQDTQNRSAGIGGWLGGFFGAAAGSMTYRDPANIASLALGGVGKTAIARIASEMGFAAVGQATDLLTGAYENQKVLNEAPTAGEMAAQVATTALGAGILRGVGEGLHTGFGALVARYGDRAPDVAAAGIANEAKEAIGPSPYGDSRAAQGLHEAEVMDALGKDTPLNLRPSPAVQATPQFPVGAFATRSTDDLFAGTSRPLDNLFDNVPRAAAPQVEVANRAVTDVTSRIDEAGKQADAIGEQIKLREQDSLPAKDLADKKAQLQILDQQAAGESNLRKLGQLNRDRAALQDQISRAEAVNSDLAALAQKRSALLSQGDTLRLARANLVEQTAAGVPGVKRSAALQSLLGGASDGPRPIDVRPASDAEAVEKSLTAPKPEGEGPKAKVIPAPEGSPEGTGETVELGQKSGPVSLDTPVHMGQFDADGEPIHTTIRQVLQDHADDDALVRQMKECLI